MKIFKTNKLEVKTKLEEAGFKCQEEAGEKSVNFVFELEEDVIVENVLSKDEAIPQSKKQKSAPDKEEKKSRRGRGRGK